MELEQLLESRIEPTETLKTLQNYAELFLAALEAKANNAELSQLSYQLGAAHDEANRYREAAAHYEASIYYQSPLADDEANDEETRSDSTDNENELTNESINELTIVRPTTDLPANVRSAKTLLKLGIMDVFGKAWPNARWSFTAALKMGNELNDCYLRAAALHNLGRLEGLAENWESALINYQKAEEIIGFSDYPQTQRLRISILQGMVDAQAEQIIQQAFRVAETRLLPGRNRIRFTVFIDPTASATSSEDSRKRWFS